MGGRQTDSFSFNSNKLGGGFQTKALDDLKELEGEKKEDGPIDLAGLQSRRVGFAAQGLGLSGW